MKARGGLERGESTKTPAAMVRGANAREWYRSQQAARHKEVGLLCLLGDYTCSVIRETPCMRNDNAMGIL